MLAAVPRSADGGLAIASLAMAVFALGEGLLASTGPTLVNSWAEADSRGRYNAAYGFALTFGFSVGPLAGGLALAYGSALLLSALGAFSCLTVMCVVSAAKFLPNVPLSRIATK